MKRRILAALLAAMLLLLVACSPANPVVGSWTLTEKTTGYILDDLSEMTVKYTFEKDGTFNMEVNGMDAANGTYIFENDVLIWQVGNNSGYMTLVDGALVAETTVNDQPVISTYTRN